MEKLKFTSEVKDNINSYIQQIQNDERVIKLFKQNNLDLSEVKNNVVALSAYLKSDDYCCKCHGLNMCNKQLKGYQVTLDEHLNEKLTSCKYLIEKQKMLSHKKNYLLCDLTDSSLCNDIDCIVLENESEQYIKIVDWVKEWLQLRPNKAFYFCGPLGVGKSYLASCITNQLAKEGKKVAFVNFPKLCSDLRVNMTIDDYVADKIRKMKKADCLVIDDIGAENVTSYIRDDVLFTILDYRMENKKATIFTSNCKIEALVKRLAIANGTTDETKSSRIVERIKTLATEVAINGVSRRSL